MSGLMNDPVAIAAQTYALYGVHLTPFQNEQERIKTWIEGWRGADSPEEKSQWVTRFTPTAEKALYSGLLSAPEFDALIFDLTSPARLFPEQSWSGMSSVGNSTVETLSWPSPSPPTSRHSATSASVGKSTPETLLSSPASLPQPLPKRRGRKPGSKDKEKRAQRGTLAHLSRAEKSRRGRESAKLHKLQEQQQQQQHQHQQQQEQ